jgi:hypothetical protein
MARSRFIYALAPIVHDPFTPTPRTVEDMADFLFAVGTVGFVLAMLGLIWALDRV